MSVLSCAAVEPCTATALFNCSLRRHISVRVGLESCLVTLEQTRTVSEVTTELEAIRARAAVELQSIAVRKATLQPTQPPKSPPVAIVHAHPLACEGTPCRFSTSVARIITLDNIISELES